MDSINTGLVAKSIGFHGQPLQKIWEGERGENDLLKLGVINPDFMPYQSRQKHFSFQDRAKRLKLHQFIAKKANMLFNSNLFDEHNHKYIDESIADGICAVTPSYESYFSEKIDRSALLKHILTLLKPGDIVYGSIYSKATTGMIIRLLCTGYPRVRVLTDLNAKAYVPNSETIPAIDRKGTTRNFITNDLICCEIIDVMVDSEKMVVGMKGTHKPPGAPDFKVTFGLISTDNLPDMYKFSIESKGELYENILENSPGFRNPNCIEYLSQKIGLDTSTYFTNMSGLRGRFPPQEYGTELRQVQASKWAFRSVAEGIEHFKEGRHSEAFQCLNKALSIDPRNVEGLVARGALYANSGSFKKAVEDFETALKLNQSHANARKYMGETLVALGRSYEEENKIEEAKKAYQDCLDIIPHHEEAQNSLDFLWTKTGASGSGKQLIEPNELTLPALNLKIAEQNRETIPSKKEKDKKNKKKKSKNRKHRSTSSTSSSDSSESSDSSSVSSSSSDSSSSTDSEHSKNKKKHRSRSEKARLKSLSPLSKRMALMAGNQNLSGDIASNAYNLNHPYATSESAPDEYELRVRKFLELTRDEENYEEKVRKFVEEAAKYRKDRKITEEKAKKKEKKKSRKLKKESKKKRKEKKIKPGKKDKDDLGDLDNMELREALKIFKNLPVFDFNSKLTNEASTVEKSLAQLKDETREKKPKSDDFEKDENKWKMLFAKDDRKASISSSSASTSKTIPKQYAFVNTEDIAHGNNVGSQARQGFDPPIFRKTPEKKKRPPTPPLPIMIRPKYVEPPQPPKAPVGQVVLDKFGNFRLASTEKPPEPPAPPRRSRSRSRSRRRYSSDSRSRSRSTKRRSRSRSYGRRRSRSRSRSYRSRTGSRSRSYSRSRSRSGSMDRRRGDRRFRGRGGYDRGTYYKPRFGNSRFIRGGNRGGGYRDFRDFRRGRERYRGGWGNRGGGGGNRYRNNRDDSRERRFDRRSRSRSYASDERRKSPNEEHKYSDNEHERNHARRDKKSPPPAPTVSTEENWDTELTEPAGEKAAGGEASLEEIEKIIDRAKKENKEDMIERNKDLLKKTNAW